MTPVIRPALATDVDAVEAVETACFEADRWSRSALADAVSGATGRFVQVAEVDGAVVGLAVVRVGADSADLERIAVAASRRRGGVGGALLAAVVGLVDRSAVSTVVLEVAADNGVARDFYAHRGFVEIARRPGYYRGSVDAVIMQRSL